MGCLFSRSIGHGKLPSLRIRSLVVACSFNEHQASFLGPVFVDQFLNVRLFARIYTCLDLSLYVALVSGLTNLFEILSVHQ